MWILVNDKEVVFPSSLSEITLSQRIGFYNQYGRELDQMLESILKMEDGVDKEMESMQYQVEKMFRTFAFFAGTTVEAIKESKFVDDVAAIYHACLSVLFEEEENMEPQREFLFKEELWELAAPEIANGSKMKFGEFIDAKQMVKNMADLGKGRWEAMLPLCCIYLRKKGEAYREEFLFEGSDRMKLMEELPMDVAMQVGFFLSATMNFWISTLTYSGKAGSKEAEATPKSTLSSTAGSIS